MANIFDYNKMIADYAEKAASGFIDPTKDPKEIQEVTINLNNPVNDGKSESIGTTEPINISEEDITKILSKYNNIDENLLNALKDYTKLIKEGVSFSEINKDTSVDGFITNLINKELKKEGINNPNDESLTEEQKNKIKEIEDKYKDLTLEQKLLLFLLSENSVENTTDTPKDTNLTEEKKLLESLLSENKNINSISEDVYQPITDPASIAIRMLKSDFYIDPKTEEVKSDNIIKDFNKRIENSVTGNEMYMFLFNSIPFIVGSTASAINSLQNQINNFINSENNIKNKVKPYSILSATRFALDTAHFASYFLPEELAFYLLASPTTFSYASSFGFSLKDKINSIKWKKMTIKSPEAESFNFESMANEALINPERKNLAESIINIYKGAFYQYLSVIKSESGYDKKNSFLKEITSEENKKNFTTNTFNDVRLSDIEIKDINSLAQSENDRYYPYANFLKIIYLYNKKIFENSKIDLLNSIRTKIDGVEKEKEIEKVEDSDVRYKYYENIKDVLENNTNAFVKNDKLTKKSKRPDVLGFIKVYPTFADSNNIKTFNIPFQFNPVISEQNIAARYESANMLSRQGQVTSYLYTEGQTLNISTEYHILSDENDAKAKERKNGPNDSFYQLWDKKTISSIEMALRSLVLPFYSDKNDMASFKKPPIVKVIIGCFNSNDINNGIENSIYPMLTYPIKSTTNGEYKFYHRTYIVTKVDIQKDQDSLYYLDDNSNIINTHGFKVNLDLTEIDPNYVNILPDFTDYYSQYSSVLSGIQEPNSYTPLRYNTDENNKVSIGNPVIV